MPTLSAAQLTKLRTHPHKSKHYLIPVTIEYALTCSVNDPSITVGARVITYDNVTSGGFSDVVAGMTLRVLSAPTVEVGRVRVISATGTQITVSENSDIPWADNLGLGVVKEFLLWAKRPRISGGVYYKDYDVAFTAGATAQTNQWPPVAQMGDPIVKLWRAGSEPNPVVYFDALGSYAIAPGATITGWSWTFPSGTPATSTAQVPGPVEWSAVGTYWCKLVVTDSNGKTSITRRPVVIVDPDASGLFTDFEIESAEVAIDGALSARFRVFGNASLSSYPQGSPVFWVREDWHGDATEPQSVGFPAQREHQSLFGYIENRSVRKEPESGDITFNLVNVAAMMQKPAPFPIFVQDATTPANWAEGKSLNVRRALFYCAYFHSTLFEIADVELPDDPTPIKIADFVEGKLWSQLNDFARVHRLERIGVTKTGRVIIRPDPQMLAQSERSVWPTTLQLQSGDWQGEVTFTENDYSNVSFLDMWGLYYDANPVNDASAVHSIAPGNPPKDYGGKDEVPYMALNGQLEGNQLAGLSLGQRNNRYGLVKITLTGNWWNAFDPAYQEYVKAPTGGFVTKEGTQFANAYFILRAMRMLHQWGTGYFTTELDCEVVTEPELSTTGDYPVDVSDPPDGDLPPILPPDDSLQVDFEADVTEGEAPLAVQFTDLTSDTPTQWFWFCNLGFTPEFNSQVQNPSHTFTEAGQYDVKLNAYSATGSGEELKKKYITVTEGTTPPPPVSGWVTEMYVATKNSGVYHTTTFAPSGAQPTWATHNGGLSATTDIYQMTADPIDPLNHLYLLRGAVGSSELWRSTSGGSWSQLWTAASFLSNFSLPTTYKDILQIFTNKNKSAGWLGIIVASNASALAADLYFSQSSDYGSTWSTPVLITTGDTGGAGGNLRAPHNNVAGDLQGTSAYAAGNHVYAANYFNVVTETRDGWYINSSTNGGTTWSTNQWAQLDNGGQQLWLQVDPNDQRYVWTYGDAPFNFTTDVGLFLTDLESAFTPTLKLAQVNAYQHALSVLRTGSAPSQTLRYFSGTTLYKSTNGGTSWTNNNGSASLPTASIDFGVLLANNTNSNLYGVANGNVNTGEHVLLVSSNEGATWTGRSGAGPTIPETCGGIIDIVFGATT